MNFFIEKLGGIYILSRSKSLKRHDDFRYAFFVFLSHILYHIKRREFIIFCFLLVCPFIWKANSSCCYWGYLAQVPRTLRKQTSRLLWFLTWAISWYCSVDLIFVLYSVARINYFLDFPLRLNLLKKRVFKIVFTPTREHFVLVLTIYSASCFSLFTIFHFEWITLSTDDMFVRRGRIFHFHLFTLPKTPCSYHRISVPALLKFCRETRK